MSAPEDKPDPDLDEDSETQLADPILPGVSGKGSSSGRKKNKLLHEKPTPQVPKAIHRRNSKLSDYSRKDDEQFPGSSVDDDDGNDLRRTSALTSPTGRGRKTRADSTSAVRGRGHGRMTLPKPGESTATVAGYPPAPIQPKASKVRQKASTMSTMSTISTASTRARANTATKLQSDLQEFEELSRENAFPGMSDIVTSTTDTPASSSTPDEPLVSETQPYPLHEIDEVEPGEEEGNNDVLVDTADWKEIDLNMDDTGTEETEVILKKSKKTFWHGLCSCCGKLRRNQQKSKPDTDTE